jgi:hypothetical protein
MKIKITKTQLSIWRYEFIQSEGKEGSALTGVLPGSAGGGGNERRGMGSSKL